MTSKYQYAPHADMKVRGLSGKGAMACTSAQQQLLSVSKNSIRGGGCACRTEYTLSCAGEQEPEQAEAGGGDGGAGRAGCPPA